MCVSQQTTKCVYCHFLQRSHSTARYLLHLETSGFQSFSLMALKWKKVTSLQLFSLIGGHYCSSPLTGRPIPAILSHFLFVYFNQENKQQNGNLEIVDNVDYTHAHTHTCTVQLSAGCWEGDEWTVVVVHSGLSKAFSKLLQTIFLWWSTPTGEVLKITNKSHHKWPLINAYCDVSQT